MTLSSNCASSSNNRIRSADIVYDVAGLFNRVILRLPAGYGDTEHEGMFSRCGGGDDGKSVAAVRGESPTRRFFWDGRRFLRIQLGNKAVMTGSGEKMFPLSQLEVPGGYPARPSPRPPQEGPTT